MATNGNPAPLPPLRFRPVLKDYIWGGRALEQLVGRTLPEGITAESWELSDHPHGQTPVLGGPADGVTLGRLVETYGLRLIGDRNRSALERGRFPLLVKLLDANDWLSVQVHPNDDYARTHDRDLGKTEMWVVLHAQPEAEIILGFDHAAAPGDLRRALETDELDSLFHRLPARAGDVFFVPPGVVHAIGPGLVLAEIQQTSDVTYRVYDWGRTDAAGRGRELHLEKALDAMNFDVVRPTSVAPRMLAEGDVARELLVDCAHFRTERLRLAQTAFASECDGSTFEIWASLAGTAVVESARGNVELSAVSWTLLPADLGPFAVRGTEACELLRVSTPPGADDPRS